MVLREQSPALMHVQKNAYFTLTKMFDQKLSYHYISLTCLVLNNSSKIYHDYSKVEHSEKCYRVNYTL